MKLDTDKIQFETRKEVDEVEQALARYIEEHENEAPESVKRLRGLLESLWYAW